MVQDMVNNFSQPNFISVRILGVISSGCPDIDRNAFILILQVLNQTSRLEIQLLENSLSTNKLEKELMIQTNEINKLHDKNR